MKKDRKNTHQSPKEDIDPKDSEFQKWLEKASEKDKALYESVKQTWEATALKKRDFEPDPNSAWDQLQMKIQMRTGEKKTFPRIAAAVAAVLVASIALFFYSQIGSDPQMIEKTATQEIELISLPDGSQVWLSPNSSLTYSESFSEDQREVHLSGKAFFEVAKLNGKRFTVLTPTTKTEVLGTSFNLDAQKEDEVSIQVTTGKVKFSDLKVNEQVLLTPGKQATYRPTAKVKLTKEPIADQNYRAWQTKKLLFNNVSLTDLTNTLEAHYQVDLEVDKDLSACRFTASFDHQSLSEVLEILKITGDLQIEPRDSGYRISGKPCN